MQPLDLSETGNQSGVLLYPYILQADNKRRLTRRQFLERKIGKGDYIYLKQLLKRLPNNQNAGKHEYQSHH